MKTISDCKSSDRDGLRIDRTVFDSLPVAVIVVNECQEVIKANRTAETMFGWPTGALLGKDLNQLLPERFRDAHFKHVRRFFESDRQSLDMSERAELVGQRRDGSELHVEGTILKTREEGVLHMAVVLRDVSERKRLDYSLRVALNEATASNRMKSHFLATMSHELRTPLNAIIGFSQLLERQLFGPLGDTRYEEYVADIKASGEHLLSVVNSILSAARLDSERVEVSKEWFSVRTAIQELARRMFPILDERRQTMAVEIDDTMEIHADPLLISQIFLNLLSNASKFSPAGATIYIDAQWRHGRFMIDIIDFGRGIPEDSLRVLGQPFRQAHDGFNRDNSGIGLGLYIAKSYLRLHGAALSILSVEGAGTTIRTCWPASSIRGHTKHPTLARELDEMCRECLHCSPQQHCSQAELMADGSVRTFTQSGSLIYRPGPTA